MKPRTLIILGIFVTIIVIMSVVYYYQIENEKGFYRWELVEGDNEIVFYQHQLDCLEDVSPETVFASITEEATEVIEDGTEKIWVNGQSENSLTVIISSIKYHVNVNENCVLKIERC